MDIISIKKFPKGRDGTHNPKMSEIEIPHREHKEPKQLIQGGIEGGENTPLRRLKKSRSPAKTRKMLMYPIVERTKKDYSAQIKRLLS